VNLHIARRNPKTFNRILEVRSLVPADLEYLRRPSHRVKIRSIRNAHHNIARLAAAGVQQNRIAELTGYTASRISVLLADPSVKELVESYRGEATASWRDHLDAMHAMATTNMIAAERQLAEHLEDADEKGQPLPVRELLAITSDRMDRLGLGKHSTSTNLNVGFAAKLEAAISRGQALTLTRKTGT
jgi:hypothetical protein